MRPLDAVECALLEAVAIDRADEAALSVLADYWMEAGDKEHGAFVQLHCGEANTRLDLADEETRLAAHAIRWRQPALSAGYPEASLVLERGVLQWPLAVGADAPLDNHPDVIRISPRYYRELRTVCNGRDAVVIEAQSITPLTTTRVALKAVAPIWTAREPFALLERERAILQRVRHRNLPRELGFAIRTDGLALVLSWGGVDLRTLLRAPREHGHALGLAFALSVACQLCDALEALHQADIIHVEVRPDHVLVAEDGTVTLIDFGYVRAAEPMPRSASYGYGPGGISPGPGIPGIRYMSREQVTGVKLDARTDVFSAALTLCETIAGVHPIEAQPNDFQTLLAIRDNQITWPDVPGPIAGVLRRALVARGSRYATAAEFGRELARAATACAIDIGPQVIAQTLCVHGVRA